MLDKATLVLPPVAHETWDGKYRWKNSDQTPNDKTVEDTWRRVAKHLASVEKWDAHLAEEAFFDLLASYRFLPAGRILAGAGTGWRTTLFNCFVMGTIDDSMEGILEAHKEAMLSLRMGGGIGHDFSSLRPKGAPVAGVGADASGPLSFMDIWDTACRTLMAAGARRGAMMATLRCDHPDIEEFVDAKWDKARFRNFNLSVLVTDDFMRCVHNDYQWPLAFGEGFDRKIYKTIRARDLWNKIMRNTYEMAEPGVVFIDRVNAMNNLHYCEKISCTNPCGEQPLPPYGACLLGSVNLTAHVLDPFGESPCLDISSVRETVRTAVRMMDNVIDVSNYPLEQQAWEAHQKRRIGLGVTGLADALAMCKFRYGSVTAADVTNVWMQEIKEAAYWASVELAKEKGPFPLFDADAYTQGKFIQTLPQELRLAIEEHGIRNSHVTSVAPTGTISLFAGNLSSGVEPAFSFEHSRKVLLANGERKKLNLKNYAYAKWMEKVGFEHDVDLPDYFVTATQLSPSEHLRMLQAVQNNVDSAVSKTVNIPEDMPFEDFCNVYQEAYDIGLKCCATYRPNDITGAVLEDTSKKKVENAPGAAAGPNHTPLEPVALDLLTNPPAREEVLPGFTYKLKWTGSDHAMYVTINDVMENGKRRPHEIFINSKNMEHYAWTVALTRMISAVFRRGGEVRFVVEELKAIFDPRGGAWVPSSTGTKYVPSVLAQIGGTIERHMIDTGFMDKPILSAETMDDVPAGTALRQCPKCGEASVIRQEGCDKCIACDYSRCG